MTVRAMDHMTVHGCSVEFSRCFRVLSQIKFRSVGFVDFLLRTSRVQSTPSQSADVSVSESFIFQSSRLGRIVTDTHIGL